MVKGVHYEVVKRETRNYLAVKAGAAIISVKLRNILILELSHEACHIYQKGSKLKQQVVTASK